MAGTLTITTLSDGTNSTSATNCIQGSAKAWVNFNGTTTPPTIRSQYNVGSVTKNGTGDFTIQFTSPLAYSNYCWTGTAGYGTTLAGDGLLVSLYGTVETNQTTSTLRIYVTDPNSASPFVYDPNYVGIIVNR